MKCPACGSEFARMRMIKGKPAHKIVGGKQPTHTALVWSVTARPLPPPCRCCCHHPLPFLPATLPSSPHLPSQQPAHSSLVLGQSLQGFSPLPAAAAVTILSLSSLPLFPLPPISPPSNQRTPRWSSATRGSSSSSSFGLHFGLGGASLGSSSSGFGRAGRGVVVEGRRRRVRRWVVVLAAMVLLVVLAGAAAMGVRHAASLILHRDSLSGTSGQSAVAGRAARVGGVQVEEREGV
ncbi:unnamed protein product, partial [Closterium sp. Naga37s-1]